MEYRNASQLMVEVERILLTEWDPVGVKGDPLAEGEYGSYAVRLTSMLTQGKSENALADYLSRVEKERMILGPHENKCPKVAHECKLLLA